MNRIKHGKIPGGVVARRMPEGEVRALVPSQDASVGAGLASMDLNLLTVFDAVMTERHVTRAAERLGLTQSAVSNSLARLRTLLGDQLFLKSPHGVVPTARALELWPVIHHSLQEMLQAIRPAAFVPAHTRRSFTLSTIDVFASLFLPRLLKTFLQDAPFATLRFIPLDQQLTSIRLVRGEADFEITPDPLRLAVLESLPAWSERYVVVARRQHPILERPLTVERLCEQPHVVVNMGGQSDFSMEFDGALSNNGLSRNIKLSVNQFSVASEALVASDLVAVMPMHFLLLPRFTDRLTFRELPIALPEARFHMIWHRRNSSLASHDWFKGLLGTVVEDMKVKIAKLLPS